MFPSPCPEVFGLLRTWQSISNLLSAKAALPSTLDVAKSLPRCGSPVVPLRHSRCPSHLADRIIGSSHVYPSRLSARQSLEPTSRAKTFGPSLQPFSRCPPMCFTLMTALVHALYPGQWSAISVKTVGLCTCSSATYRQIVSQVLMKQWIDSRTRML